MRNNMLKKILIAAVLSMTYVNAEESISKNLILDQNYNINANIENSNIKNNFNQYESITFGNNSCVDVKKNVLKNLMLEKYDNVNVSIYNVENNFDNSIANIIQNKIYTEDNYEKDENVNIEKEQKVEPEKKKTSWWKRAMKGAWKGIRKGTSKIVNYTYTAMTKEIIYYESEEKIKMNLYNCNSKNNNDAYNDFVIVSKSNDDIKDKILQNYTITDEIGQTEVSEKIKTTNRAKRLTNEIIVYAATECVVEYVPIPKSVKNVIKIIAKAFDNKEVSSVVEKIHEEKQKGKVTSDTKNETKQIFNKMVSEENTK